MEQYRIKPETTVDLDSIDTYYSGEIEKKDGKKSLKAYRKSLRDLQVLLYSENQHKVLIVLQGIDASGKDGTIRHVFGRVNPQGTNVANFKVPTPKELAHDYLWRIHQKTPGNGEIVIFNRSHYEDVLIVRVHNLVPESVWERRYRHINEFERLLVDEGTVILKFFLHISKEEQAKRFLSRLDRPHKRWKFNPGDLEQREHWNEYKSAFEAMLSLTSTSWAPWYVIPGDRKWYRNLAIASVVVDKLNSLDMHPPVELPDIDTYRNQLAEMIVDDD